MVACSAAGAERVARVAAKYALGSDAQVQLQEVVDRVNDEALDDLALVKAN